jgi:hypothetical protein
VRITWLADVLRAAGLQVVEHPGWKTRERPGDWSPRFLVAHATAAPASQSDATQVRIVRDGRADLNGPIANACIDRQGRWHVLAAGRCNTTVPGTVGPFAGQGNSHALGIEACNDNRGEAWPPRQYESYVTGVAAICRRMGWPESRIVGHREHTPGHKTDPTFGMNAFRALVRERIEGDDMTRDEMLALLRSQEGKAAIAAATAPAVWAHPLRNPYSDVDQEAGTILRYVPSRSPHEQTQALIGQVGAAVAALAGRDAVDEPAIVAGVLAGLTPEVFAAAMNAAGLSPQALAALIPAAIRQEVADELAARLAS